MEFVRNVYLENGHQVIQCNIRDMTARLQAEAQVQRQREALFQSEKLATMGQLLAGVAHELNNPLSVVMGQAALLQHASRDTRQAEPQGAVFRVTLPVAAPHGAALEETPPAGVPTIRGKRVLVVDDEPGIAGVVAEVLALDGHVVETVAHGGAALAKVRAQTYNLILSDIRMPDVDGPSFYRELARRDPQLLPRVIFMTGDTLSASTRAFLEQTRVPCVHKPFTLAEIRAIVQRTLHALEEASVDG